MLSCSLPSKQLQGSNRLKLKSVTEFGKLSGWDIVLNSSATYITQLGYIVSFINPSFPQFLPIRVLFSSSCSVEICIVPSMSTFSLHP